MGNRNNVKIGSTTIARQSTKSKQRGRLQPSQQQAANKSEPTSNQAKLTQETWNNETRSQNQKSQIRSTKAHKKCFNLLTV